ncbi:hypothetical protein JOY44_11960 [Phormidium sp. CLA17]|uniref:hypothetical protein n=1 Tax=Leptolyngbya sp. Cla-17 TaxID=2803751 RepID=UPI001492211C|nr:hypothetical protein [Leptolyngbya sp. Cla-17]MBM0742325.1 hypothetical protein [Leptolyngbya sp. Cla-17]
MQPLPREFVAELAKKYELSFEQEEAFVERFSSNGNNFEIAEILSISESAFGTRMSGVYNKFSIRGKGPGKLRKLHDFLLKEYQKFIPFETPGSTNNEVNEIDELVREVRDRIRPTLQDSYGKIRLLNGLQINVNDLFVEVYLLSSERLNLSPESIFESHNLETDRLAIGNRGERQSGITVVEQFKRLVILGKPGMGKSTFLQHLAIACNQGDFQPQAIPVLLEFRDLDDTADCSQIEDNEGLQRWVKNEAVFHRLSREDCKCYGEG